MSAFTRDDMRARVRLFEKAVLQDQRSYYQSAIYRHHRSAIWVNRLRALFALLAGIASALAGFIVSDAVARGTFDACDLRGLAAVAQIETTADTPAPASNTDCFTIDVLVPLLMGVAVVAPALGAGFTTLADLYQWERLTSIYNNALENLEMADAQSPIEEMDDIEYGAAMTAFAEGTLNVMADETAQWGQLVKTPEDLQVYIDRARQRAARYGGSADDGPGIGSSHLSAPPGTEPAG